MKKNPLPPAIRGLLKLDPLNGERDNVYAFIRAYYGGRGERNYNFDQALEALGKLTLSERLALVDFVVRN